MSLHFVSIRPSVDRSEARFDRPKASVERFSASWLQTPWTVLRGSSLFFVDGPVRSAPFEPLGPR